MTDTGNSDLSLIEEVKTRDSRRALPG